MRLSVLATLAAATAAETLHCTGECQQPDLSSKGASHIAHMKMHEDQWAFMKENGLLPAPETRNKSRQPLPCIDGMAGEYACKKISLDGFVSLYELGTDPDNAGRFGGASDIWGWTDPETGSEYAIMGMFNSTGFIDVTVPTNPQIMAVLPQTETPQRGSDWRDIKVYKDHAFIVSDANSGHGVQVYDLTQLRSLPKGDTYAMIEPDLTYYEHGSCHNIAINEETGFAYSVATDTCNGGLHFIDINNPREPKFAGCFADDGTTHDAECVVYRGPDERFYGREICFGYNERALTIVDVTDKSNPVQISRTLYEGLRYCHQGWLTEDMQYMLMNDEGDETRYLEIDGFTRTLIWDMTDLANPVNTGSFMSTERTVDHNLYIHGDLGYLANYCSGIRIVSTRNIADAELTELAYFDVAPLCETRDVTPGELTFAGAWSSYVFPDSGTLIVSSIERGLFVLNVDDDIMCVDGTAAKCEASCSKMKADRAQQKCVEDCKLFCEN